MSNIKHSTQCQKSVDCHLYILAELTERSGWSHHSFFLSPCITCSVLPFHIICSDNTGFVFVVVFFFWKLVTKFCFDIPGSSHLLLFKAVLTISNWIQTCAVELNVPKIEFLIQPLSTTHCLSAFVLWTMVLILIISKIFCLSFVQTVCCVWEYQQHVCLLLRWQSPTSNGRLMCFSVLNNNHFQDLERVKIRLVFLLGFSDCAIQAQVFSFPRLVILDDYLPSVLYVNAWNRMGGMYGSAERTDINFEGNRNNLYLKGNTHPHHAQLGSLPLPSRCVSRCAICGKGTTQVVTNWGVRVWSVL